LKHFIGHGIHELTHFDSKIFRTLKTLIFAPGTLTADYLAGRKKRYVPPLRLYLVVFAISFFLYTRPGVSLYDVRVFNVASYTHGNANGLEKNLESAAEQKHISKEMLYERFNEHWQHDVSLFQLSDVIVFALILAAVNWRRYFVEHLIFSLHTLSFAFLYECLMWLYYARFGFRQNLPLIGIFMLVLFLYLWRALPRVYATSGWKTVLKAAVLVVGLEFARIFFLSFTLTLANYQTVN
ncbi:MAG TPA: DUF3667 domain-containing protein, partial [Candidatus Angelobacter sp.]